MQDRKRPGSGSERQSQFRRLLRLERFEPRLLMAADLQALEPVAIPKEPIELVLADQAHYNSGGGNLNGTSELIPLLNTFQLHSRPSAEKTVYLDFDGFTASGTAWNAGRGRDPIVSPAWDTDGNGADFSDNELRRVQGIWQRVAADFAAFDINVTTEEPPVSDLVREGGGDTRWGIRVVFTPDDFPAPGAGGVAYINSFNWGYESIGATDTPCYVFNMSEVAAAAAASHEVGHALGLSHDGTTSAHPSQPNLAYYEGHGSGENSWGPIMGVGGYYRNVTTWDDGTYFAANNGAGNANYGSGPDDLQIITNANGFGYVPDPESNFATTASPIEVGSNFINGLASIDQFGVISQSDDIDFFSLQVGAGLVNLTIDPYVTETFIRNSDGTFTRSLETAYFDSNFWAQNQGANLDILATLYDAAGNVIATSDPVGLSAVFTDLQLDAGVYYLAIDGTGFGTPTANPPVGYSDYASLGQYLITGTAPVALGVQPANDSVTYTEDTPPVQVANTVAIIDGIVGDYSRGSLVVSIAPVPQTTDRLGFAAVADLRLSGNTITESGLPIGTLSQPSAARLAINLNANATQTTIEKLVQSVTFRALGDAPSTSDRQIQFTLSKGQFSSAANVAVNVVPTNDAPLMNPSMMAPVAEDTPTPPGQRVGNIFASYFADPDLTDSMSGIAIVGNTTPSTQGVWQFSVNATAPWQPLGPVSSGNRLMLSAEARLRLIPAADYHGIVQPLQVQAIDSTFTGQFSTPTTLAYLPAAIPDPMSPIAISPSDLAIEVTPINDAPRAQVNAMRFVATQEQLLAAPIPADAFFDIEGNPLTYTATLADGSPLPRWLRLNASTATFEGTPRSLDVVQLNVLLRATDTGGLTATIPVVIDVINVNDPPANLRITNTTIAENSNNARLGRVSAFDPDGDSIEWTSSDPRFVVRSSEVFVVGNLDFETIPNHQLQVTFTASDSGSPALSSALDVVINVTDINEHFPVLSSQTFFIPDGAVAGTVVGQLQAVDNDIQQTVKYRLHSGNTSAFTLDELSGELQLAAQVSYASLATYKVIVEAYDNGTPSFKSAAQMVINVERQNVFPPTIDEQQTLRFAENVTAGTIVGQVAAADADATPLIYTLLSVEGGSPDWLQVNRSTGVVTATTANRFDFESSVEYAVIVSVREDAVEARSATGRIVIDLQNANDAPTGIGPVAVYSQRQGVAVTSEFVVEDQDPSAIGYTFSTTDPRFEVRGGKLALRPNQFIASSQVGSLLTVPVTVVDNSDPMSSATLDVDVTVQAAATWQNPLNAYDVNRDGDVSVLDLLLIINEQNSGGGARELPAVRTFAQLEAADVDTTGDNLISPLDVLIVINYLNARAADGELSRETPVPAIADGVDADSWFQAFSEIDEEDARRRRR